jgi:hypothetical protein
VKRAFLDDARPADVSHAVRDVLERRGALVSQHVSSRVRFHGLPGGTRHVWTRAGYVGIFQRLGETEVEVRLLLRARWPWRILFTVAALNLVAAVAVVATDPPPNTWILVAFAGGFALLVAALLHLNTLRPVREEERLLMDDFEQEFRRVLPSLRVEDDETRFLREAELSLEGEVTARRVAKARKSEPAPARPAGKGLRFNLFPGKKAPPPTPPGPREADDAPESPEDRRARLLARKAELEAQRAADDRR